MEIRNKSRAISNFIFILFLFFFSCANNNEVLNETLTIENELWDANNRAVFSFDIEDTLQVYDIYLQLENSDNYNYSNIFLFSDVIFPNQFRITDTLEFVLSNHKGDWIGEKSGTKFKNIYPYKANVRFPKKGKYIFEFEQAMRCRTNCTIEGISAVGIIITKRKKL